MNLFLSLTWSHLFYALLLITLLLSIYIKWRKISFYKTKNHIGFSNSHYLLGMSISLFLVIICFNIEVQKREVSTYDIEVMEDDGIIIPPSNWELPQPEIIPPPPENKPIDLPKVPIKQPPIFIPVEVDIPSEEQPLITDQSDIIHHNIDSMMLNTKQEAPKNIVREDDDEILIFAESMPVFPGCDNENYDKEEKRKCTELQMLTYVQKNLKYPALARENNIQGTVVVQFVIDKSGKMTDLKVRNTVGGNLSNAAMDVMKKMEEKAGLWTPGMQQGKQVKVKYNIPIKFKLE